jgi:hypothetical protein
MPTSASFSTEGGKMQNVMNSMLLISATLGSLALGVLLAYVVCTVGFAALKMHSRSLAGAPPAEPQIARVS